MSRREIVTEVAGQPSKELAPGVRVHMLATGTMGAQGVTTSLAIVSPKAELPYHCHPFSEVIIVVSGEATVRVEGRTYLMRPFDTLHVPAGTAHSVQNRDSGTEAVLHSSFASDTPTRETVEKHFEHRELQKPPEGSPETLIRFDEAPVYELAPQAFFRDLFARRFGARGICGGYGVFQPGASLPCHFHDYDESITIVSGRAVSLVAGQEYHLQDCATACIPRGRPHRFINRSDKPMAMIWVYAGDEPERTIVDSGYCDGTCDVAGLTKDPADSATA